jgi:hypothetical protein
MQTPISLSMLETSGLQLQSILQELEENFPVVNPHPDDPTNLIMYRSGQRSVVEWINHRLTENNGTI